MVKKVKVKKAAKKVIKKTRKVSRKPRKTIETYLGEKKLGYKRDFLLSLRIDKKIHTVMKPAAKTLKLTMSDFLCCALDAAIANEKFSKVLIGLRSDKE